MNGRSFFDFDTETKKVTNDEKVIRKDIYEYDEYGRLRRREKVSEYHTHNEAKEKRSSGKYRAVKNSDMTWLKSPPASSSEDWRSDYGKKLGIAPVKEPRKPVTVHVTPTCPHGYEYHYSPRDGCARPLACDVCCPPTYIVPVAIPPPTFGFVLPRRTH